MNVVDINDPKQIKALESEQLEALENLVKLKTAVGFNEFIESLQDILEGVKAKCIIETDQREVDRLQGEYRAVIRMLMAANYELEKEDEQL